MKLFGQLKEVIDVIFRSSSNNEVTINPDTAGASGDVTLNLPPVATGTDDLVSEDATQTITNKTIDGDDNTVQDLPISAIKTVIVQANKFISRDGSGIVVDTKDVPQGDVIGTSDTQTLSNKTIDADVNSISNLAHGYEVNNPSSGVHGVIGDVVGTSDTQTLTNKTLTSPNVNEAVALTATSTDLNQLTSVSIGGSTSGDVVTIDDTQTLTAKTIDADNNTISNLAHGDEVDEPSTNVHGVGATSDIVGTATTQTLTNKTLTSPNVNEAVALTSTATELNQLDGISVGGASSGDIVTIGGTQTMINKSFNSDVNIKNQNEVQFAEQTGNGTNYIAITAPDAVTANTVFKLPDGDGTANQVLKTDGSLNLGWTTVAATSLTEDNVRIGDSSNAQQEVDTTLLGDVGAHYGTATVTFDETGGAAEDICLWTAHGRAEGSTIYFTTTGSLPTGLSVDTLYFVRNPDTDYFQLSATANGDLITFTGDGSATTTAYVGGLEVKESRGALAMSDAEATKLGLKQYLHGTTYNGGNAPTVSGFSGSIERGVFIPYQTQDGTWRLKFNFSATHGSATSLITGTIAGVTFKNTSNFYQGVSLGSSSDNLTSSYVYPNTGNIRGICGASTSGSWSFSGDVELESKPTWAY